MGAGICLGAYVTTTTLGGYLMLFDAAAVPADGAVVPLECIVCGGNSTSSVDSLTNWPLPFTQGLVAVFSTTGPYTKTTGTNTAYLNARIA